MIGPTWRQIAVRAWELRPSWKANTVLVVAGTSLWWFYGMPWWLLLALYLTVTAGLCSLFGWLELLNEAAEQTGEGE